MDRIILRIIHSSSFCWRIHSRWYLNTQNSWKNWELLYHFKWHHSNGLIQKRRHCTANALKLHFFCIKPFILSLYEIFDTLRKLKEEMSDWIVITLPADGLAPSSARPSRDTAFKKSPKQSTTVCQWVWAFEFFCKFLDIAVMFVIWVRSRNCGCLVTWFCYQLIAKPGNKTATDPWPVPYHVIQDHVIAILDCMKLIWKYVLPAGVHLESWVHLLGWCVLGRTRRSGAEKQTSYTFQDQHCHRGFKLFK